jgi:hypothetical protein
LGQAKHVIFIITLFTKVKLMRRSMVQGQTLIIYGIDYRGHIEDVFVPALSHFFNGLTTFQGHNGK